MMRILLLVAMAVALIANPCIAADLPRVGDLPPGISLPDISGKTFNLSDLSGKPVILAFFVSWSKTCKDQLQLLNDIYAKYASTVEVVAISLDKKTKNLKEFADANEYGFRVLIDKKLSSINKYSVMILPTLFTIGRDGKLAGIYVDYDENVKKSLEDFVRSVSALDRGSLVP